MSTNGSTGSAAPASTGAAASSSTGSAASGSATWPDGWRKQLAGDGADEQELKRLERFTDPSAIYRSYREMETRLSKGELKSTLPANATPEQQARWRQENGIPADPKEYKVTLPQGREAPKEDDALLNAMRASAHKANYSQAQWDAMVGTFYAEVDRTTTAMDEAEQKAVKATEAELRKSWGADADTNFAMLENLLARAPEGMKDGILNGYVIDPKMGRVPFRASQAAMNWLVSLEREINPAATVVTGAGGNLAKSIEDEIAEIEGLMRTNRQAYNKDEKKQARLRDLYAARDKLKAKAA